MLFCPGRFRMRCTIQTVIFILMIPLINLILILNYFYPYNFLFSSKSPSTEMSESDWKLPIPDQPRIKPAALKFQKRNPFQSRMKTGWNNMYKNNQRSRRKIRGKGLPFMGVNQERKHVINGHIGFPYKSMTSSSDLRKQFLEHSKMKKDFKKEGILGSSNHEYSTLNSRNIINPKEMLNIVDSDNSDTDILIEENEEGKEDEIAKKDEDEDKDEKDEDEKDEDEKDEDGKNENDEGEDGKDENDENEGDENNEGEGENGKDANKIMAGDSSNDDDNDDDDNNNDDNDDDSDDDDEDIKKPGIPEKSKISHMVNNFGGEDKQKAFMIKKPPKASYAKHMIFGGQDNKQENFKVPTKPKTSYGNFLIDKSTRNNNPFHQKLMLGKSLNKMKKKMYLPTYMKPSPPLVRELINKKKMGADQAFRKFDFDDYNI